jgi:hypothetical protein
MSAPASPALRPSSLGEVIDRAAAFWREHWRPLFQLALPFQLAEYVGVKGGSLLGERLFPEAHDPASLLHLSAAPGGGLASLAGLAAVLTASLLATFYVLQVGGVAITHFMVPRLTGAGAPSALESAWHAARRLGPSTGAYALSLVWGALVAAGWLLPGLAALGGSAWALGRDQGTLALVLLVGGGVATGAAAVGLGLWFVIRFVLLAQVVGAEPVSSLGAFRRAGALTSGRVGPGLAGWVKARITLLLTVVGAILLLVSVVASAPSLALGVSFGASFLPGHALEDVVPQRLLVPVQVLQVVVGSLFAPIYEAFKVVFYLDMRVRREGLDLELRL